MSEEMAVAGRNYGVVNFEEYAMGVDNIVKQIGLIHTVMERVMKNGEHYGVIPGCGTKPSLLKPGAEKLGVTFRLAPSYKIVDRDLPHGHREYEVVTTLTHIPTGQIIGEGVGSCSTMEGKYRFRTGEVELTGKPVPSEYWKERDLKLLGGKGFVTKKNPDTGKWEIARQGEKVEHDNPADYYNTVLKMAKKRSQVDAILTATAASDIFTQDIEDMQPETTTEKTEIKTEQTKDNTHSKAEKTLKEQVDEDKSKVSVQQMQYEIGKMLFEMYADNAADELQRLTTWKNKEGKEIAGKREASELNTKENAKGQSQTSVTFQQVKKIYADWLAHSEGPNGEGE